MPVIVETVTAASAQDLTDLHKVYADAPDWLLPPHADAGTLIESALASGSLIAGRFNARLLGAGLLTREGDALYLSHLCVRRLTRNRGVASRLVAFARQQAAAQGLTLYLRSPAGHLESRGWAVRFGLPLADS